MAEHRETELAAPRNVSATRSGPGLLVAWSAVAGAEAYVVSRARKHSLSFFPLETGCWDPKEPHQKKKQR